VKPIPARRTAAGQKLRVTDSPISPAHAAAGR